MIGEVLNLSRQELAILIGLKEAIPTKKDIGKAIETASEYLDSEEKFAIIIDLRGFIHEFSLGFKKIMYDLEVAESFIKEDLHIFDILFSDDEKLDQVVSSSDTFNKFEVYYFLKNNKGRENEEWFIKLIQRLSSNSVFNNLMLVIDLNNEVVRNRQDKYISINISKTDEIKLLPVYHTIAIDSRFEIIDYAVVG